MLKYNSSDKDEIDLIINYIFLPLVDFRSGAFLHYPYEGGLFEQPAILMKKLRIIQSVFVSKIASKNMM